MNAQQVSNTILNQLGGNRFVAMTDAKNFLYADVTEHNDKIWLRMDLGRNKAKVNKLKIYYNAGQDTYTMHFYKQRVIKKTFDVQISNEQVFEGVHDEMLASIFTEVTGMYLTI